MDQYVVLGLSAIVFAMFSVNFAYSLRAYVRRRPDRRRAAPRLRFVISSAILEVGVASILIGRLIATFGADPETRRVFALLLAAAISGALLVGGAFLVLSWILDDGDSAGAA